MAGRTPLPQLLIHLLILSFCLFGVDGLPNAEESMETQQKTWKKVSPSDCKIDNKREESLLLCITAMPWCGTSRRLMHDVEKLINTGHDDIRNLDLRWVDSHKEKEHLKLNENDVLPMLKFVGKGVEWKYDAQLSAEAVLQAARYLSVLKEQAFPLREFNTLEDIRTMVEPAIRAFVIVDNCGWSNEILNREANFRENSRLETQLTINESLLASGGQATGVVEEIKLNIGEQRDEGLEGNVARKSINEGGLQSEKEWISHTCLVGDKKCHDVLGQEASPLSKVTFSKDKEGYEGECKDVKEEDGNLDIRKDRDRVGEKHVMDNHIEEVKVGENEQIKDGKPNAGESNVDSNVLESSVQIGQDLSIGSDPQSQNEAARGKSESSKTGESVDSLPNAEQVSSTFRIFNRKTGKGDPKARYACTRLQKSKFIKAFESLRQDAIDSVFTPWLTSYGIVRNGSILVDIDSRLKDLPWAFLVHSMDVEPQFFVLPGGEADVWDWSHKLPRPPLGLLIPEDYVNVFQEDKPTVILFLDKTSPLSKSNQELVFSEFRKVARHYADISRITGAAKYDFEWGKKPRTKTTGSHVDIMRLKSNTENPSRTIVLAKGKQTPIGMETQILSPALGLAGQLGLEVQLLNIDLSLGQNAVASLLQTLLNSGQLHSIEIDNTLKTTIETSEGRSQQLLALAQKQTLSVENGKKIEKIEEMEEIEEIEEIRGIEEYQGNSLTETSKEDVMELKTVGSEEGAPKDNEGVESTLNIVEEKDKSDVLERRGDKEKGEREGVTSRIEQGEPESPIHRTGVEEETDFLEVKSLEVVGDFEEGQIHKKDNEVQMRLDEEKGEVNKDGGERGTMDGKDENERSISVDGNGKGEDEHEGHRNTGGKEEEEEETQEPPNDSSTRSINFFFMAGETILPEKLLLGSDFPSLSLIHPVKREHYAFPQNLKMTKEAIISFIEAVLSGEVVRTMRSSPLSKPSSPSPPPTPLITKTFRRPGRVASLSLSFFAELVLGRTCGKRTIKKTNNDTKSDTGTKVGIDSQKLTKLDKEREGVCGEIPGSKATMGEGGEGGEATSVTDVPLAEKEVRSISISEKSKTCVDFSGAMSSHVETCSVENENTTKWENENTTKWENEVFCEDNGAVGRDVVVLYTTSWCGFCRRMELVYEEAQKVLTHYTLAYGVPLTEHKDESPMNTKESLKSCQKRGNKGESHCDFLGKDELKEKGNNGGRGKSKQKEVPLLFRMDCTSNDCSGTGEGSFQVTEYPTVVLYPAHRKNDPILFTGYPTVTRLLTFLGWRSGKQPQNLKEKVSKKAQKGQTSQPRGNKKLRKNGRQKLHRPTTFSVEGGGDKTSVVHSPLIYGKQKKVVPIIRLNDEETRTFEAFGGKNRCKILTKLNPGSLLVASEQLGTSELFGKSVILVLKPVDNPMGVILNHRLEWNQISGLQEEVKSFLKGSFIGLGGPIMAEVAVPSVILTRKTAIPGFVKLLGHSSLYWGSNLEAFKVVLDLITRKLAKPDEFWLFIGFSGWTNSQLIGEVAVGSWYPTECSFDLLGFPENTPIGKDNGLWEKILKHLGRNPKTLL